MEKPLQASPRQRALLPGSSPRSTVGIAAALLRGPESERQVHLDACACTLTRPQHNKLRTGTARGRERACGAGQVEARVGRGAGAQGARGAKIVRPRRGRGAQQKDRGRIFVCVE